MNRKGVTLTLSLFLLSSILPAGAQKNKPAPKTSDSSSSAKNEKSKKAETTGNVLKGWINEVDLIMTDAERSAFKKLTTDEERENFSENFWLIRDPTPDTPENEYRDQFYERIDYANDHFASGIAGMRTDRGKMYILNGPPDEIQSHPAGGTYHRTYEEGGGVTTTFPFETWRYRHLEGAKGDNVIYEFVDSSNSNEYKLEIDPGAKDALRNMPNMGLTAAEVANGTDKSERMNKSNSLLGSSSPDLPTTNLSVNNMFDMLEKYNRAYEPLDVKYNDLLVPAATRLSEKQLPFKVQTNYVKVTTDTVRTLISIQIMNRDLSFQENGGAQTATIHIKGSISRIDNRRMPGGFNHDAVLGPFLTKDFIARADTPNIFQETAWLTPGRYKLQVTIEDKHAQTIGMQPIVLNVPRIPDQTLQSSSMILAYSISKLPTGVLEDPFAIGDVKVLPNVTSTFRRDQNLNVWMETYGLSVDQGTHKPSATYELLISQNKQEVKKIITSSTDLAGAGQQMKYANTVPLTDFNPGQYEVQLRVTDNISKDSFVTTNKFTVTAGSGK